MPEINFSETFIRQPHDPRRHAVEEARRHIACGCACLATVDLLCYLRDVAFEAAGKPGDPEPARERFLRAMRKVWRELEATVKEAVTE